MGMYDSVRCEKRLPLNKELRSLKIKWNKVEFQTKDLDNCLINYVITKDGDLIEEVVEYEYTYYTEEERKSKDFKPWNIIKDQKIAKQYTKKVDYHGKITFYDILKFSDTEDIWVDFEAYFSYGKLDKLVLLKTEKHESRDLRNNKFWEEHNKRKNSFPYKLKKRTGWFWFWTKVSIACYKLSRLFADLQHFILKHNR